MLGLPVNAVVVVLDSVSLSAVVASILVVVAVVVAVVAVAVTVVAVMPFVDFRRKCFLNILNIL